MLANSASRFRFPKPTDEDLQSLSQLAYSVSTTECGDCKNYHIVWPLLRSIGANGSGPEHCWSLTRDTLNAGVGGRPEVNWLIGGAADAGIPALVYECCRDSPDTRHSVTLVDRCETPLALTRSYAEAVGAPIEILKDDLLNFRRDSAFDLVIFHYTFVFFDGNGTVDLLNNAKRWLAPDGRIFAFVNFVNDNIDSKSSSQSKRRWRKAIVEHAISRGELSLPEDLETFFGRLENTRQRDKAGVARKELRLEDHLTSFHRAGFFIDRIVDLPSSEEELLAIGALPKPRAIIIAGVA